MTINKAVSLAMLTHCRMNRKDDVFGFEYEPTDGDDCVIVYRFGTRLAERWNPNADDLTYEGWGVVFTTPEGERRSWYG